MPEIIELREQMAQLATQARTKLDEIDDKTESARAKEIEQEFDRIMEKHDSIGERVERMERIKAAEDRAKAAEERGDPRRPNQGDGDDASDKRNTPEYKEVFEKAVRYGVSALDDEEREIMMEGRASVPSEVRAQSVGTESAGGYTVPEEFSGEIDRAMAAWGPMWNGNIVRELNTSNGRVIKWPTIDDTANTGRIKAENAAVDDDGTDDATFGEKQLDAYVYDTGMVKMPIELLQDSAFNIEGLLDDLFGERLGRLANSVLTTGTGSSQPNGIVTASALGKTAASATAITADELIDLVHSVDPAYRSSPRCRFQFNDTTLAAIRKLKDGQGNYLWQMGDVRSAEPSMILGHPYSINQAMASIATGNKSVLFGDHSKFIVRKVLGFQVITLRERYAENFQIGMVGFKRFDSELINTAAIKHLIQA